MRGSVWPGACASALRDLHKALASKSINGTLDMSQNGQSPRSSNSRSIETPNTTSNVVQSRQRQHLSGIPPGTSLRGNESSSASIATQDFRPTSSQQYSQHIGNQDDRGMQRPASGTSISHAPASTFQEDQFADPTLLGMMNGMYDIGEQFDGVGDIFQLMDASYQLGEQMFEPSFAGR